MRPQHASERGVTLAETLVALFVIAIMATAGAVLTGQSLRGARAVEEKGAKSMDIAVAAGMIRDDLAAYVPRTSLSPASDVSPALFEGYAPRHDGMVMAFVRNGWVNTSGDARSSMQRVEYAFSNNSLVRRSWASTDPAENSRMAELVLIDGLSALDVRFGRGNTWSTEWVTLPGSDLPVPQKAEFTLTFTEGDQITLQVLVGSSA